MLKEIVGMQEIMLKLCAYVTTKKPIDLVIATGKQSTVKNL